MNSDTLTFLEQILSNIDYIRFSNEITADDLTVEDIFNLKINPVNPYLPMTTSKYIKVFQTHKYIKLFQRVSINKMLKCPDFKEVESYLNDYYKYYSYSMYELIAFDILYNILLLNIYVNEPIYFKTLLKYPEIACKRIETFIKEMKNKSKTKTIEVKEYLKTLNDMITAEQREEILNNLITDIEFNKNNKFCLTFIFPV